MKKILPFLFAALLPASAGARAIGSSEAAAIAAQFLHGGTAAAMQKAPLKDKKFENEPYYIFNRGAGAGFVIVSGDDRLGSVLGYADKGCIDPDNAPEGLRGLLDMYENAYSALGEDRETGATALTEQPVAVVEPLLGDIAWGQNYPFNNMTPVYTQDGAERHYYTGCVATAATQIMRYYSYPAQGSGSKTYTDRASGQTLSADFGATAYDWANMPAVSPVIPRPAVRDAYATLAAQMGVALEMQYEVAGSGTYDMLVPYALRTYFGYDAGVRSHRRDCYPTSEWMAIIKAELDAGRPVFYGGTSHRGTGGHAFVLDGYDSADYVHVNWGWTGRSNGYFMINHLDPQSLGEGGGAGGYNLSQDMVTGIRPATEGSAMSYALYGASRFSFDGPFAGTFNAMSYVENIDVEPYNGRIEVLLTDKDGNIAASLGGEDISIPGFSAGHSGSVFFRPTNVTSEVSGVADGDYIVRMGYRQGDGSFAILRHPKGLPACYDVKVSRGIVSIAGRREPAPDCVLTEPVGTDGDFYAGGAARLSLAIANRSADFVVTSLTLRLTSCTDASVSFDTSLGCNIYDESAERLDVLMPVSAAVPEGDYWLTAVVKEGDKEYAVADGAVGPTQVRVKSVTGPVVRVASEMAWTSGASDALAGAVRQGELFGGTVALRNAALPGSVSVRARFVNETTGESIPLVQSDVDFTGNTPQSVSFARYLPFDPGSYRVTYTAVDSDGRETPLYDPFEPTIVTVASSDKLTAEMVEFSMPERLRQGERVACSLTYRGLATVSQNLYVRLRRLTYRGGELAYRGSQRFEPGVEKSISFNYRPGTELEDGLYMVIAQTGNTSAQTDMGNYSVYGRVIAMGDVTSAELIEARNSIAVWVEGRTLRCAADGDCTIDRIEVYNAAGTLVATDADLSALAAGFYIARVALADGRSAVAKIAL